MKIVYRKVSSLIPYEHNNKIHPEKQISEIADSIQEFGFMQSLVIDNDNVIVVGHARREAAKKLGMEKVPCVIASELTDEQIKKYRIVDNRLNESPRHFENLKIDLVEIGDVEFAQQNFPDLDLDMDGNGSGAASGKDEIDDAKEIKTDIKLGDIIEIGDHRLMCGDSTSMDDVSKLMDGQKAEIGFTSPPYNGGGKKFNYDYKGDGAAFYSSYKDNLGKQEYKSFLLSVLRNYKEIMREDSHSLFWNVMYNAKSRDDYGKIIFADEQPFQVRETIVRDKGTGFSIAGDNILSRMTELIFLLSNSEKYRTNQHKRTIYWNKWTVSNQNAQDVENDHKACFPLGLPTIAINDFSKEGDGVVDLFLGSGTTMVACENTKRRCYGMELDPKYCQVIVNRMLKNFPEIIVRINGKDYLPS